MNYEYNFEFYPLEMFKETISSEPRHVFICLTDGKCKVDEKYPEFGKLLELFQAKANEEYEVVQMFFQERGVLVLYKKSVADKG
jgi:hypothetical protein